jgi:hypothetical protein
LLGLQALKDFFKRYAHSGFNFVATVP